MKALSHLRKLYWYFHAPTTFGRLHDDPNLIWFFWKHLHEDGIQSFVETGTFRGDTTMWVAERFPSLAVYSFESYWPYHWLTKTKKPRKNVEYIFGDSSKLDPTRFEQPTMYWLDAHWGTDVPLRNEVQAIVKSGRKSLVVIDDFAVPGRADFTHEYWMNLRLEGIKDLLPKDTKIEFPELGPGAGWVALFL